MLLASLGCAVGAGCKEGFQEWFGCGCLDFPRAVRSIAVLAEVGCSSLLPSPVLPPSAQCIPSVHGHRAKGSARALFLTVSWLCYLAPGAWKVLPGFRMKQEPVCCTACNC